MAQNGDHDAYDYIICGGGTTGCTLAGRLAMNGVQSVLLVEAGTPHADVPASRIPAALAQVLGSSADWNIWSEPNAHLNDRKLLLNRGKFVGGSSGMNGTLCIRGTRQDFDDWGLEGWSGDEVFRYMNKAETFHADSWFKADPKSHGGSGPIQTEVHRSAPISERMLQSFQSKDLPLIPDLFSTGSAAAGCGYAVRTIYKGVRSTAADYLDSETTVTVKTGWHVDRVVLEQSASGWTATGVELRDNSGTLARFHARKEVIVAGGSFGSPAILMRSGIGPKAELEQHNITPAVIAPGVGQSLEDHAVIMNFYEANAPDITEDRHVWHTGGQEKSMAQYQADATGFLSQFPFGSFAWARLEERLADVPAWQNAPRAPGRDPVGMTKDQPHVEFWNTEIYFPTYANSDIPGDEHSVFAMAMTLFGAKSRGTVRLQSTDPLAKPIVDHRHLSDPLDMLLFAEACRLSNEIVMEGAGTKDIVRGSWPASSKHHTFTTREEWEQVVRKAADTCYHPAGTCKMGRLDDPMVVVDEKLRVRNVANLRVADASVIPKLHQGHPQMVCYAIGEKLADLLTSPGK